MYLFVTKQMPNTNSRTAEQKFAQWFANSISNILIAITPVFKTQRWYAFPVVGY